MKFSVNPHLVLENNIDNEFNCSYISIIYNNKFSGIIPDYDYTWEDLTSKTKVEIKQIISKYGKY